MLVAALAGEAKQTSAEPDAVQRLTRTARAVVAALRSLASAASPVPSGMLAAAMCSVVKPGPSARPRVRSLSQTRLHPKHWPGDGMPRGRQSGTTLPTEMLTQYRSDPSAFFTASGGIDSCTLARRLCGALSFGRLFYGRALSDSLSRPSKVRTIFQPTCKELIMKTLALLFASILAPFTAKATANPCCCGPDCDCAACACNDSGGACCAGGGCCGAK